VGKLSSNTDPTAGPAALSELAQSVRGMETDDFWIVSTILTLVAIGGFFWAFYCLRRARVIEDTPTSKIRSAAQGYVELHGQQLRMDGDPISAPLSKLDCTWWAYEIERHERSGKNSYWRTIHKGISEGLFLVDDGTARCIVDPDAAEVTPSTRIVWNGHSEWPDSAPDSSKLFGFGRYRYTEQRMHHGEELYALGFFHTRGDHMDIDMNAALGERLRGWKQDRAALLARFDADGDGQIDGEEWERAREAAKSELREEYAERLAAGGIDVLAAPPDGRPYLLSVQPQEELARSFRFNSFWGIVAFFIAGAISVFMLTARLA
jgi:E3 Ubiquitin ligase